MLKLKRTRSEIECEFCGKIFMQTRWWQVFCSKKCKKSAEKTAKSRVKELEAELIYLRKRVEEMEENALAHIEGRKEEPRRQEFDDENQEHWIR